MLPTESILIKIFQFKHEARGRGSGKRSGGDVLVICAGSRICGRAGGGAGVHRVGLETPSCTPSPCSLPPAGLNINSADLE